MQIKYGYRSQYRINKMAGWSWFLWAGYIYIYTFIFSSFSLIKYSVWREITKILTITMITFTGSAKRILNILLSVKEDQRLYMQWISYYNASYRKYAGRNTWFRPAWTEWEGGQVRLGRRRNMFICGWCSEEGCCTAKPYFRLKNCTPPTGMYGRSTGWRNTVLDRLEGTGGSGCWTDDVTVPEEGTRARIFVCCFFCSTGRQFKS